MSFLPEDKKTNCVRLKLLISYRGTGYKGWQKQSQAPSVQETLEKAFQKILQQNIKITGAARTDTKAHALGQVAHCDIPSQALKQISLHKAVNAVLPPSIRLQKIFQAPADFHALKSALCKTYIYVLDTRRIPSVFRTHLTCWHPYPLPIKKLQEFGSLLMGTKDFKSFQNTGSVVQSTIRTLYSARWYRIKKHLVVFEVTGDGFLKQMVRNLVGTQLELLRRGKGLKGLQQILQAKDRKKALKTAPASGLYLKKIYYPAKLDRQCKTL